MKVSYEQLVERLLASQKLLLCTHRGPDADGIGSELGLEYLLRSKGKDVLIVNHDEISHRHRHLDPEGRIRSLSEENPPQAEELAGRTVVVLDNSDLERTGDIKKLIKADESNLIIIDHHEGIESDGKSWFLWPQVGSTSEIVFELIEVASLPLPLSIAKALYVGIVADTGHFRYSKTTPRTHCIAAKLLEAGVESAVVGEELLSHWPVGRLLGRRKLYESLHVNHDETIAYFVVDKRDISELGISFDDLEGIINELIEPTSIQIGIIFSRREEDSTRVSLRSKRTVDLLPAVRKYGGGGHKNACGATIPKDLHRAIRDFLPIVEACLVESCLPAKTPH